MWLALLLTVAAPAAECPWSELASAEARLTSITVDGVRYEAAGLENRLAFEALLRECDEAEAEAWFEKWRARRRTTNITAAIGMIPGLHFMLVGTIIGAISAGQAADELELALRN